MNALGAAEHSLWFSIKSLKVKEVRDGVFCFKTSARDKPQKKTERNTYYKHVMIARQS